MIPIDQLSPAAALLLAGAGGLLIGSFLNVVIHRLPKMLERGWQAQCAELAGDTAPERPAYNLVMPRSQCPACGHPIGALENIPVISYLALRGKCIACKTPISVRYPLVEVVSGVLAMAAVWRFGATGAGLAACGLLWSLVALTFIDFDTQFLPDNITMPLLWAGLLVNLWGVFPQVPLRDAVIGAVAGYLSLWTIYWLFKILRGKEGMGYGDFKLLGALGAWLGWKMLLPIIALSSLAGALIGVGLMVFRKRDQDLPLAFGPYLAIAGAAALFLGPRLSSFYLPG
jgi:leader peptidase (prepilin peptidase)/N-methyltransferase